MVINYAFMPEKMKSGDFVIAEFESSVLTGFVPLSNNKYDVVGEPTNIITVAQLLDKELFHAFWFLPEMEVPRPITNGEVVNAFLEDIVHRGWVFSGKQTFPKEDLLRVKEVFRKYNGTCWDWVGQNYPGQKDTPSN